MILLILSQKLFLNQESQIQRFISSKVKTLYEHLYDGMKTDFRTTVYITRKKA